MQALRIKTHLDRVCAGRNIHGTQNIISTGYIRRLAVNGYLPSRLILDFGEYDHTVFGRRSLIYQVVRLVADKFDGTC